MKKYTLVMATLFKKSRIFPENFTNLSQQIFLKTRLIECFCRLNFGLVYTVWDTTHE